MRQPGEQTRQTYDAIATRYAERSSRPYPELLADIAALETRLPDGGLIADIGCGPGRDIDLLRKRGFRVIGFDLSFGQLHTGGRAGVAQADMQAIPVRGGTVDAIWCHAALLHIPQRTVPAVLAEFARIVRPGGLLHLVVAEGDGERWEVATQYGSESERWFAYHREPDLVRSLETAGFSIMEIHRHQAGRNWLGVRAERLV